MPVGREEGYLLLKRFLSLALAVLMTLSLCSCDFRSLSGGEQTSSDNVKDDPIVGDGSSAQFGGEWPENEFTKLVPKPNFDVMGASSDDGSFTVAFSGVEIEQVKAYADKVKAKGFTIDATEESQNVYGVSIYTYTAYNSDGYCVEITFANGTSGITISK